MATERLRVPLRPYRALLLLIPLLGSCGGGSTDPGTIVTIVRQPTQAVVDEVLVPPIEVLVEDASSNPLTGAVTISLDPNPCDWGLAGTTTVQAAGGRAVFSNLSLGQVAGGQVLSAAHGSATASTLPIDVRSGDVGQPLVHENTLCSKPNDQRDAESITLVPEDDAFWLADDDNPSVFQVTRSTGAYVSQISGDSIVAALPTAAQCEDGDGDPTTFCSYVGEFEHIAYNRPAQVVYVVNTVNRPEANPVEDRAAIFILRRTGCQGCLTPSAWQPMPDDYESGPIVMIQSVLHVALGERLYPYDYADNRLLMVAANGDSLPPVYQAPTRIRGAHFDGSHLWVLLVTETILKVDWPSGTVVEQYDLAPFGIGEPRGIQVVGSDIYIVDGDPPNPIYVFRDGRSPTNP